MERKQAAQLIQEQMKILFAFAFSKVRNKEEAEDLCSEIIVQVLNSISCINLIEDNIILNKDGDLKPNFPVLTQDMLESLWNELNQIIEDIKTSTLAIIEEASKILKNHAPKNLKDQYGQFAFIKYKLDVMACIVEEMVRKQYLQVPKEKEPLAILGIRK